MRNLSHSAPLVFLLIGQFGLGKQDHLLNLTQSDLLNTQDAMRVLSESK
jgi:hypothetical protein